MPEHEGVYILGTKIVSKMTMKVQKTDIINNNIDTNPKIGIDNSKIEGKQYKTL